VKAVIAGAIGVRRKADHERVPLNPVHLVSRRCCSSCCSYSRCSRS
jgi:hypothetical protein